MRPHTALPQAMLSATMPGSVTLGKALLLCLPQLQRYQDCWLDEIVVPRARPSPQDRAQHVSCLPHGRGSREAHEQPQRGPSLTVASGTAGPESPWAATSRPALSVPAHRGTGGPAPPKRRLAQGVSGSSGLPLLLSFLCRRLISEPRAPMEALTHHFQLSQIAVYNMPKMGARNMSSLGIIS